jgi:CBS domain-containing protein
MTVRQNMHDPGERHVPVTDGPTVIGLVSVRDVLAVLPRSR